MRLIDWREADSGILAEIWRGQIVRWNDHLGWDSASNWAAVEHQRRAGLLPGLILLDGSRVRGWTFFLVHRDTLQVGAFEADSPESTRALLDAVSMTASPELAPAGAMLFGFSAAPGLVPALIARGFEIERYGYFVRDVTNAPAPTGQMSWTPAVAADLPALLSSAYGDAPLTRPFARGGSRAEWEEYVAQLIGSTACGRFAPELSAAHVGDDGRFDGVILTTVVSPVTAHIAQVAVNHEVRGQGIAAAMVHEVVAKAKGSGLDRVSLLVAAGNRSAVNLYTRAGFSETARFISAGWGPSVKAVAATHAAASFSSIT